MKISELIPRSGGAVSICFGIAHDTPTNAVSVVSEQVDPEMEVSGGATPTPGMLWYCNGSRPIPPCMGGAICTIGSGGSGDFIASADIDIACDAHVIASEHALSTVSLDVGRRGGGEATTVGLAGGRWTVIPACLDDVMP